MYTAHALIFDTRALSHPSKREKTIKPAITNELYKFLIHSPKKKTPQKLYEFKNNS